MNEPPDDRALAAYTARASHHTRMIALVDETIAGLVGHPDRAILSVPALVLGGHAKRSLRVMEALSSAWHCDMMERQTRKDQWERQIRARYPNPGR